MSYRVYMTDSVHLYGENKHITNRWYDILRPAPVEDIDADTIAVDIIQRAGLVVT